MLQQQPFLVSGGSFLPPPALSMVLVLANRHNMTDVKEQSSLFEYFSAETYCLFEKSEEPSRMSHTFLPRAPDVVFVNGARTCLTASPMALASHYVMR